MPPPQPAPEVVHALPRLAARPADANKGIFGRVLIVAGSRGMTGAAVLCGSAALRGGAGLVRLAVPESVLPVVAAGNPCYMTVPLPEDAEGRLSEGALEQLVGLAGGDTPVPGGPGAGGTGDVLTGLTAALLAQGLETFAAAQLAVYLHGLAGDLARDELGEVGLLASDLLAHLPRAFRAY